MIIKKGVQAIIILVLSIITAWQWGQAVTIYGKAYLAKWLIANAWEKTLNNAGTHKPWPWADTWPVAKVLLPNGQQLFVLSGSAGNSLAFGPGHNSQTALPGYNGASVIGGHRDTHFTSLQHIEDNDLIQVQNTLGRWSNYRVEQHWVANSDNQTLTINPHSNHLYLITCYPFSSIIPGGSERFVVQAVKSHR